MRNRNSMRLQGYDYSKRGLYFVTGVVQDRLCLFGKIVNGKMILNDAGKMVEKWYLSLSSKFSGIRCHEFIVMPNHYHFLIEILPNNKKSKNNSNGGADPSVRSCTSSNLSQTLQWFKTMTTNEYIRGVKEKGWRRFSGRLWQRSFDDRIIRGYKLDAIRKYIKENPKNWKERWR
ncbi:MAG: transposase [Candidatus Marinimicrobia bacterium]|nr:transposase [Candidatus Neomarinimicrobiota bacterium]